MVQLANLSMGVELCDERTGKWYSVSYIAYDFDDVSFVVLTDEDGADVEVYAGDNDHILNQFSEY